MKFKTKFRLLLVATMALVLGGPVVVQAWKGPCPGYGRCDFCQYNCRGFEGQGERCTNCGHDFERHH